MDSEKNKKTNFSENKKKLKKLPRLVIGALSGGSGKTTLTIGIVKSLIDVGINVGIYKKGPDYIDTLWHNEISRCKCRNLDPYLMGKEQTIRSFGWFSKKLDAAIIEGNRGIFDGRDVDGNYSTSKLAHWLESPVLIVVNCKMVTRTVAAMILGCKNLDPSLNLIGVVINFVSNSRHESIIRSSIEKYADTKVLGVIPKMDFNFPQRHMGLITPKEYNCSNKDYNSTSNIIKNIYKSIASNIDLDSIWKLMKNSPEISVSKPPIGLIKIESKIIKNLSIGIILDSAFNFYYSENLEILKNVGAKLIFCSSLFDKKIPNVDALYIGGGFPETNAFYLEANTSFRIHLKNLANNGLPIYAECGGLMYLGRKLIIDNKSFEMTNVFPIDFTIEKKPQGHGYSSCKVVKNNPFFKRGDVFKAHTFHYSRPIIKAIHINKINYAFNVISGSSAFDNNIEGIMYNNVVGTYHHIHSLSYLKWANGLINAAENYKKFIK